MTSENTNNGYLVTLKKSVLPKNSTSNLQEATGGSIPRELLLYAPQLGDVISWLNRRVRIVINDGRKFVGILKAMDKVCNLVLSETVEFPAVTTNLYKSRILGLVVIPGAHVDKIEEFNI